MRIFPALILIFLISQVNISTIAQTSPPKIQIGDTWIYKDVEGNVYNETAVDLYIYADQAYVSVETERAFPFPYSFSGNFISTKNDIDSYDVSIKGTEMSGTIELSQKGGIPINNLRTLSVDVSVTINYSNGTVGLYQSGVEIDEVVYETDGIPGDTNGTMYLQSCLGTDCDGVEVGLVTGAPATHRVSYKYNTNQQKLRYTSNYLLSSLNENNYTLQYDSYEFLYSDENLGFIVSMLIRSDANELELAFPAIASNYYEQIQLDFDVSSLLALELQYDETEKLPVYIKQVEPAKTINLNLNNFETITKEYFLDRPNQTNESEENGLNNPSFGFFSVIFIIHVVIRKMKK